MAKKFRIIATPPGQAPEWVRKEWIGLELPLNDVHSGSPAFTRGVLGGQPENLGGYMVDGGTAIDLLAEKSPEAADWWHMNAPHVIDMQLVFKREMCELVE